MATIEIEKLPFRDLADRAEALASELESGLKQLRVVLRDIDAAERNQAFRAARQRGEDRYDAAQSVVRPARYVLNVIDAQCIGNTSDAWHTGVRQLREALDELDRLS
jgi:hypothetical protein